ncbi:replication restart helicase PriA [Flavobacterium subsaxonicum]|uniref:Replication restart protein PriA n=1 Tax=Flavobacterium subsaxonicum WB 4.1-42 = DSM 21790 TaxID=1121898 RepID=A0A0A2MIT3_9FLAO|nr:primosomal protein N' [Flavobacterium subsaxonicum]KGO92547.1 primosomal protein N' [Flavobacterium subsaxonicum WB 4.1-42 = DSM 21790]
MPYFTQVILPLALPKSFTYSVNEAEYAYLKSGMRVAVPFGKNKIYTGLVIELHQNPPQLYQAKEIHQILDDNPIVTETQLQHWNWIAEYYMCTIGEVYKSALPGGFILESETIITSQKDFNPLEIALTDEEYLVYEALQTQSALKVQEVVSILNKKTILPVINRLIAKNAVSLQEEISEKYKPKTTRYIRLQPEFLQESQLSELMELLSRAQKQREAVLQYFQLHAAEKKPVTVKKLTEAGTTAAVIKSLIDKGVFEEYFLEEDRVQFTGSGNAAFNLSEKQQGAFDEIKASFDKHAVTLLHGITSSGKTEIYIRLIEEFINSGKQVLYLLPEIALTTQLVVRLTAYFGNKVAVFHSKYTNNERVETWQQVLEASAKAQVVIGARSALFLPFQKLGLIIIDEEHEQTFKQQDPAPRYHARDAAIVLANMFGAKVLLGSATPSIESYSNVNAGKYGYVALKERFGKVLPPEIILVDIKDKYKRKRMTGHFSDTMTEAIAETLALGKQVILFQNRRGFSPWIECMTCGHVPQCPQCDVSLTYYKYKNQLRCHYCAYHIANPTHCHQCHSTDISSKGFGTEQIELELKTLFPDKNSWRMDQDTTRGKHGYEKIIDSFKNREIDILVGTQMLAKGLHFDNVGLVGILNADNMLFQPDFRAFERAYQMMVQVAGRAGRKEDRGTVLIQTYNPLHNVIRQVTENDYEGMFKEQIYERHNFKYPPYFRLVRIILKHKDYEKLKNASLWLHNVLMQHLNNIPVLGPEEPGISRIRNEYIRAIMIKIPPGAALGNTKRTIGKILESLDAVPQYRSVKVTVNVDPY